MSDVLKDDLSLLFPFLSIGNTFRLNISKKNYSTKLYYKTDMYNYIVQLEGSQNSIISSKRNKKFIQIRYI